MKGRLTAEIKGRDVLYALRDAERERRTPPLSGITAFAIAHRADGNDGRSVAGKLRRLEDAGLVRRVHLTASRWATTERGREVERLLSESDAARGGSFRPTHDVITDLHERLALAL